MSEEEEVYVPIFIDLCDLTTNIINRFTDEKIEITCKEEDITETNNKIKKQVITDPKILSSSLEKYEIIRKDNSHDMVIGPKLNPPNLFNKFFKSYPPPIFYVNLKDLMKNLNLTRNEYMFPEKIKSMIQTLLSLMNGYYFDRKNPKKEYIRNTYTEYNDGNNTVRDSPAEHFENFWSIDILSLEYKIRNNVDLLGQSISGGKPSRKRKTKNTKRRKTQKKNTKKRSRK